MRKRRETIKALAWYLGKTTKEARQIYSRNKSGNLEAILQIVLDYQTGTRKRATADAII